MLLQSVLDGVVRVTTQVTFGGVIGTSVVNSAYLDLSHVTPDLKRISS